MISKKAQEEMIGFVMIMVVVAVIFVIVLGLYIGQNNSRTSIDSEEISQFLSSAFELTTNCTLPATSRELQLNELIQKCYSNLNCESGENSCNLTRNLFKQAIESVWNFSPESLQKGYDFTVFDSDQNELIFIKEKQCTQTRSIRSAVKSISAQNEALIVSLKICL